MAASRGSDGSTRWALECSAHVPGPGAVRGRNPPAGRGRDENVTVTKLCHQPGRANRARVRSGASRPVDDGVKPMPHCLSWLPLFGRVDSWRKEPTQCNSPERQWRNLAQRSDQPHRSGKEVPSHVTNKGHNSVAWPWAQRLNAQVNQPRGRTNACERERLLHPRHTAAPA
jgi:hypothetical protein